MALPLGPARSSGAQEIPTAVSAAAAAAPPRRLSASRREPDSARALANASNRLSIGTPFHFDGAGVAHDCAAAPTPLNARSGASSVEVKQQRRGNERLGVNGWEIDRERWTRNRAARLTSAEGPWWFAGHRHHQNTLYNGATCGRDSLDELRAYGRTVKRPP